MNDKLNREKIIKYLSAAGIFLSICMLLMVIVKMNNEINSLKENIEVIGEGYNEAKDQLNNMQENIKIYLPKNIYAASGLTMELYNSQITSMGENIENYNTVWICEIGKNMQRKFSVDAADELIGEYPLVFRVYDNKMQLLAEAETNLKIIDKTLSRSISILTIGDSLSDDVNTYFHLAELSGAQISFLGTKDIDGYCHEGRRGFSASDYLNETYDQYGDEKVNPFYNKKENGFDWNYYKSTTGIDPDVIEIFLGINGIDIDPADNGNSIREIVDRIRMDDEEIPIYVVNTIYSANQDGIGSWLNSHGQQILQGRYKFEEDRKVFNLCLYLEDILSGYDNVFLVPAGLMHDSRYNYETTVEQQNPYSEIEYLVPNDGMHPGKAGYYQIADCIYSTMLGTMDEW